MSIFVFGLAHRSVVWVARTDVFEDMFRGGGVDIKLLLLGIQKLLLHP